MSRPLKFLSLVGLALGSVIVMMFLGSLNPRRYQRFEPHKFDNSMRMKGENRADIRLKSDKEMDAGMGMERDCKNGMLAFTYATNEGRFFFCRSLESMVQNRVPIRILGWGEKWKGFEQKLRASLEAIRGLSSECTVLFVDSYDVLFTQDLSQIKGKFDEMDADILFSAECGCWPFVQKNRDVCRSKYPKAPTPYKYLNYGGWIARQDHAVNLLEEIVRIAGERAAEGKSVDDQEIASELYIEGRFGIKLDHYSRIFQTMHFTRSAIEGVCNPLPYLVSSNGVWHNRGTGSRPSILHFNGGGKRYFNRMYTSQWYKNASLAKHGGNASRMPLSSWQLRNSLVDVGDRNRTYRYRDLCPSRFWQALGSIG